MMKSLLLSALVFTVFIGCLQKDIEKQNELQKVDESFENVILKDTVLDERIKIKILSISKEVREKLKINMHVVVELDNGIDINLPIDERKILMQTYYNLITKDLPEPNITLALSSKQFYLNILSSNNIISEDSKNDILENYMIPILASKENHKMNVKINGAVLNGFSKLADVLAEQKDLKLQTTKIIE